MPYLTKAKRTRRSVARKSEIAAVRRAGRRATGIRLPKRKSIKMQTSMPARKRSARPANPYRKLIKRKLTTAKKALPKISRTMRKPLAKRTLKRATAKRAIKGGVRRAYRKLMKR